MARRDVDLVIKARDQAADVVKSITAALNDFVEAQSDLSSRADKTETTLTALGSAIGKLDKQLKGLSAGDALAQELSKSEAALSRMEARFDGTQKEAAQLNQRLRQSEQAVERYAGKLAGAAAAQERQSQSLKALKQNQADLTFAYKAAVASQDRLANRQAQLPGLIDKATLASKKAANTYSELAAKMAATSQPSKTLQERFEASSRATIQTAERLQRLEAEYSQIGLRLDEAGRSVALFAERSEKASQSVQKQENALKKIGDNYRSLESTSRAASTEQGKLASQLKKVEASLEGQAAAISKAKSDYSSLGASTTKAQVALDRLASGGLKELNVALRQQGIALLNTKRAYAEASSEATRLGAAVAKAKNPSQELVSSFEKAKVSSAQLKGELIQQRRAFNELSSIYQRTEGSIEGVRSSQIQFAAVQDRLANSLARSGAAARQQTEAINRLSGSTSNAIRNSGRLADAQARTANANARAAASTNSLAAAYQRFYGDSRRSLSLLQRIRGEVLSLVAAYGGLFAGIQALRGAVDATQQLEAAQSRLNVAFNNDTGRVASELDFLQRTAARLGVNFGTLATEYSKFNIATKNTALEGAAARKVFIQVAEAARVNRSSTKELSGVFVALTQIVSKGAVQMEELRQQLGDRLPGALQIMADGLNVTTGELIKMLEQGQVTEEALISFGDELEKRFGGGLSEALNSLTVALGRLGNAAFQALLKFGEAGFIESFTDLAGTLTEVLNSADFEAFAARVSRALSVVVDFLGFLATNFQAVVVSLTALIAFKLTPLLLALGGTFTTLTSTVTTTTGSFLALQTRAAAMGVTVTRTQVAVRGLTRAFRGLAATTGVGLIFVGISAAIAAWATEADTATEALNEHRKIVSEVKDAYDAVGQSVEEWQKSLTELTAKELENNIRRVRTALDDLRSDLEFAAGGNDSFFTNFFGRNLVSGTEIFDVSRQYKKAVTEVVRDFNRGSIEAKDFLKSLSDVSQQYDDGSEEAEQYSTNLFKVARATLDAMGALEEAEAVLAAATGSLAEAGQAAVDLGLVLEDATEPSKEFADAFADLAKSATELDKAVPKSVSKIDEVAEEAKNLAEAYERALTAARALPDAIQRAAAEQKVFTTFAQGLESAISAAESAIASGFDGFTEGVEAAAAFLRQKEGFISTPKFDVNALRVGFGSDTVTLADGSVRAVTKGISVSIEDANRDLVRRITQEFVPAIKAAVGEDRYNALTPQQQAALISLSYNYGAGELQPGGDLAAIAKAVREGSKEGVVAAIAARAGDNNGVNRGRRLEEAALFRTDSGVDAVVEDYEKRLEDQKEFRDGLQQEIETLRQEAAVQSQNLIAQEQQKALRKAEIDAKKVGLQLSQDEREAIKEQVAAKFALKQQEEDVKNAREAAAAAEARVNALLEQRRALDSRLEIAASSGDTALQTELEAKLKSVNAELAKAIEQAKAMWQAIGGADAETALIQLDTAALKAETLAGKAKTVYFDWKRVGDLFINGMASAFDKFAQSVAAGENVFAAAKNAFLQFASDFLREIAQMIIKQAIFNALSGTSFGNFIGIGAGTGHSGGLVGSGSVGYGSNLSRRVSPAIFASAARFHSGGLAGLRPGEVPIIAKKNEEILTEDDPRHMFNSGGGSGSGGGKGLTLINAVNGSDAMEQALAETAGQEVFMNFMRSRRSEIAQTLGINT